MSYVPAGARPPAWRSLLTRRGASCGITARERAPGRHFVAMGREAIARLARP
ncbi:MAG TPA: hypothetical protein VKD28_11925 [Gemmatimonadales bacterium]|nr:hypothetical protein [Gemmatimonadales bacterium]